MRFNPKSVSFGRHETFPLRYSWLPKGFQSLVKEPGLFSSESATVALGVGKNMVNAIRYWLVATSLIEHFEGGYKPTRLGEMILDENEGYDPYLEDEATIWLVHWLLATNPEEATAWYWFFNRFHKPEFTSQEAANTLADFAKQNSLKASVTTVRNDAAILLRMYARSKGNTRMPIEEALDSPLSLLGLITQSPGGRSYSSRPSDREGLPLGIFGFAIASLMIESGARTIPIEDLMYARGDYAAPGAVFRLTENALITKLERLVQQMPKTFELRETAGIHQLYMLDEIEPYAFLDMHYAEEAVEAA